MTLVSCDVDHFYYQGGPNVSRILHAFGTLRLAREEKLLELVEMRVIQGIAAPAPPQEQTAPRRPRFERPSDLFKKNYQEIDWGVAQSTAPVAK